MALTDKQRIDRLEKWAKKATKAFKDIKKWSGRVNTKVKLKKKSGGGQQPPAPPSWPP